MAATKRKQAKAAQPRATGSSLEEVLGVLGALPRGPTTEQGMYLAASLRVQAAMLVELRRMAEAIERIARKDNDDG